MEQVVSALIPEIVLAQRACGPGSLGRVGRRQHRECAAKACAAAGPRRCQRRVVASRRNTHQCIFVVAPCSDAAMGLPEGTGS